MLGAENSEVADRYLPILDALYTGIEEPAAWQTAMADLCDALASDAAAIAELEPSTGEWISIAGAPGIVIPDSPMQPPALRWACGEVTRTEVRLARRIVVHGAGVKLTATPHAVTCFIVSRHSGPSYSEAEVRMIEGLAGHLRRAVQLRKLSGIGLASRQWLEQTGAAAFVLDRSWRVLDQTAAAERLAEDGALVRVKGGRLWLTAPAAQERLQGLPGLVQNGRAVTFGIADEDARQPSHICSFTMYPQRGEVLYVLTIRPVHSDPGDAEGALRNAFGLTGAEASLAVAIVQTGTMKQAAELLKISVNTAKTQIAGVFVKTGARNQLELARLVMQLASNPV